MATIVNGKVQLSDGTMVTPQTGGWYNAQQYWGNTLSQPGQFNSQNNLPGQQGTADASPENQSYIQQRMSNPSAMDPRPSQFQTFTPNYFNQNIQPGTGPGVPQPSSAPAWHAPMAAPYTVKAGDTLSGIYGADWAKKSGYTGDPTKLAIGTQLPDPNGSSNGLSMTTAGNVGIGTNSPSGHPTVATATTKAIQAGADPDMLARAKQYLGSTDFIKLCERFTEQFTKGATGLFESAIAAWNGQQDKASTNMANIKPGDALYFKPDASNQGYGHTGVYAGNNQFINPANNGVQLSNLGDWMNQTGQQLLGYVSNSAKGSENFASKMASDNPFNPKTASASEGQNTPGFDTNIGNVRFGSSTPPISQGPISSPDGIPRDSGGRTQVVKDTPSWVIPIVQKAAQADEVPTALLTAVAKYESGGTFDASRREDGGGLGRGMFQIDIGQNKNVTEAEADDPNFAAKWASDRLREGYDRTGNWNDALRYYNAYSDYASNRRGYNGQPLSQISQEYARRVMALIQEGTIPVQDQEYQKKIAKSLGR